MTVESLLLIGLDTLKEYMALHVLMCLVPAFFLAGAIASLFSKESVLRYFGADAPKYLSYSVASVSGVLLAVCSCTVLPLFAGIYKRGAGIGPASAFLFSAPAINLLAIVYTAKIIGFDIGAARAVAAVSMSIVIGLVMATVFRSEDEAKGRMVSAAGESEINPLHQTAIFVLLLAILVLGGIISTWMWRGIVIGPLTLLTVYASRTWFDDEQIHDWLYETWDLTKKIFPLLLVGVFFAGIIVELVPSDLVVRFVGGNSIQSNLIASVAAALMYFATLTEVPIIDSLMKLGMGAGPVLAMLLAGPALSLPNMIVISRVMGVRKASVYIATTVTMATTAGFAAGIIIWS
ncbi:MAG: permease [Methanosarcinales archaeon]|nr:permease [Methanosarcinales archaeon]